MSGEILLPSACSRVWVTPAGQSNRVPLEIISVTRGSEVAKLRHHLELSQRELADLLGTTESTVSRLERSAAVLDTRWSSHLTLLFAYLTTTRRHTI